jgi:aspartyl-tRNA(Asn)/glutamyl-tRNA(Gln) amidotransferase subunit A
MRGSKIYENFVSEEDAPSVARLKAAGGIMIGKTTTPEFGFKGMTDSPLTGVTRNSWNLEMTPGGSSGGAAAQ